MEEDEGALIGRSFMDAPEIDGFIEIEGDVEEGKFVDVRIESAHDYYMEGRIVG